MERQLAAIMAADVVGYSLLMGRDEAGTLTAIEDVRSSVLEPEVKRHRGTVIKSLGDGWLVTFPSSVDAVNCAITVQEKLAKLGTLKLRIGVHIGDIVRQQGDIFGDSVNVTARLESIAEPGGITISDHAYSSLDNTLSPAFLDGGARELKNIARPVQVWERGAVLIDEASSNVQTVSAPVSLFIAPVVASDSRAELHELATSFTGDAVAMLGTVEWLAIAPSVSGAYQLSLRLRARGDRLRMEASLRTADDDPIWSDRFDGNLGDAFEWQDKTVEQLSSAVRTKLRDVERSKLEATQPSDLTAAQCYLLGVCYFEEFTADSFLAAIEMFILATEKAPDFGLAFAQAAIANAIGVINGWGERFTGGWTQSMAWIKVARELEPESGEVLACSTIFRLTGGEPIDLLQADFRRAGWLSPNNNWVLTWAGWAEMYGGRPVAAIEHLSKALRLSPFDKSRVFAETAMAMSMVQLKDFATARQHAEAAIGFTIAFPGAWRALLSAQGHLGDTEGAARTLEQLLRLVPKDCIKAVKARNPYANNQNTNRYLEGLRLGGLPEV